MGAYHLDRFNGQSWVTMAISSDPVSPDDYGTPDSQGRDYPSNPKLPSLAGLPGYKARVRFVDVTTDMELETYDWAKIPFNPTDPDSDLVWGWKCTKRATYPSNSPIQHMKVGASW